MDHPFGFPDPFESSLNCEQRISEEIAGHYPQISPFFNNPLNQSRPQSAYFRTRMCVRFMSGCCFKGEYCNFAHSIEELRRPLRNGDGRVLSHQEDHNSRNLFGPNKAYRGFYNGEICDYGEQRGLNHMEENFFFNQKSMCWKTKICHKWATSGNCPFKDQCSYAHGDAELRRLRGDNEELTESNAEAITNCSDDILSRKKAEPSDHTSLLESQPKIRSFTLKKISRIYGDWIDGNA